MQTSGADTGALAQATTNNTSAMSPDAARALVDARYATIGRTGVGTGANQIDIEGRDAWVGALVRGELNPADLNTRFSTAVTDYMAQNPADQYTNYVKNYLGNQSGATGALTQANTNLTTNNAKSVATDTTTDTANPLVKLYQDTLGRTPSQAEIDSWNFGKTIDARELDTFLGAARNEAVTTMPTAGLVNKLANQILAQGKTQYWGGEGYGSAEKNAYDMAVLLAGQGFTDINDLGKVTKYEPVQELYKTYNGQQVITQTDEEGKTVNYVRQPTGEYQYDYETGENRPVLKTVFVPPDAKLGSVYGQYDGYDTVTPVDPSKVTIKDGKAVVAAGETFGNVKTGETINSYYDKASQNGPDIWGGTFAGEGSTAYGVKFDASGKPVFYSKYGGSSNDLVNLVADNPILGAVANYAAFQFGGPAGVAMLQAAMGKSVEDIAKSTLLAYVGGEIAGNVSGSTELINTVGTEAANVIGRSVGKFVSSEGKADILTSLAGGAIDVGIGQITDNIEGFSNLTKGEQDFTRSVISTTIKNGGDLSLTDLVDAALTAGTAATKAAKTGTIADAIQADKTVNDAVTAELNNQLTIDASGAMDLNAAAKFAEDSGYNKFTFDGKTYTLDNNNAANTIAQLESDALTANTAANLKGGEFEGVDAAVAANTARNNTVIGNAEADNIEEAAYLAKQRNPTGTTFTFDGKTYTLGASNTAVTQALNETQKTAVLDDIKNAKTFNEAFATARAGLGAGQTFTWQRLSPLKAIQPHELLPQKNLPSNKPLKKPQ